MRVAIVHDWLTGMRGGERCLELLCELFPEADLYTLLHVNGAVSPTIEKHPIQTSFIQRLPLAATHYRYYLPLFPRAIESFDLKDYDLVLSSSHCVAKGVRVPPGSCHLAYIYTPMRYIWDQYESYFAKGRASPLVRGMMRLLRRWLQRWDVASTDRVHYLVAISEHVARRIQHYYGRAASVVYPPVDWHGFEASRTDDGFYLMVTALAPYKRVDLAIAAANRLGIRLLIIGSGQAESRLRRQAGPTVKLLGWQPDPVVREAYARCRAVLFPGEEDFGLVPLEAMASGKPVIAYGRGGVLESVVPLNPLGTEAGTTASPTGVFFYEPSPAALIDAIRLFERHQSEFDPLALRAHVEPFDRAHYKEKMQQIIAERYQQFTTPCR